MVDQLKSSNQSGNPCLGGRYEILGFDRSEKCHPDDDVVHYRLIARDLESGKECIVPVTQVGLRFDGRALQKKEILRANHALESHKQLVGELRQSEADQGSSADANVAVRHGPLIVSHAGIGRNAVLITFNDIRTRILEDRSVDRNDLDQILLEVIAAGRQARGPRFFHTKEQLKVVRQTLLELIEEVEIGDARESVDRLASTDQASRHRLMRYVDLSELRERDHQPALPTERQTAPADDAAVAK